MLDRFFRRCYGAMLFLVLAALAGGSANWNVGILEGWSNGLME